MILKDIYNKPMKYKELCEVFGLERERGSKQQKQINNLKKQYQIEKNNSWYIIKGELNEMIKLDNKKNPTLKDYIVPLIYSYIKIGQYSSTTVISRNQLLKDLGLINDNVYYIESSPDISAYIIDENLTGDELLAYTKESRKMLNQSLTLAMKELTDKGLAYIYPKKMKTILYINECGEVNKKNVELTSKELEFILKQEGLELEKRKVSSWSQLKYFEIREIHETVERIVGYPYFEGFQMTLNIGLIESYAEKDYPLLKSRLSDLSKEKIMKSKRKNIGNITPHIRGKIFEVIHRENPTIILKDFALSLDK